MKNPVFIIVVLKSQDEMLTAPKESLNTIKATGDTVSTLSDVTNTSKGLYFRKYVKEDSMVMNSGGENSYNQVSRLKV